MALIKVSYKFGEEEGQTRTWNLRLDQLTNEGLCFFFGIPNGSRLFLVSHSPLGDLVFAEGDWVGIQDSDLELVVAGPPPIVAGQPLIAAAPGGLDPNAALIGGIRNFHSPLGIPVPPGADGAVGVGQGPPMALLSQGSVAVVGGGRVSLRRGRGLGRKTLAQIQQGAEQDEEGGEKFTFAVSKAFYSGKAFKKLTVTDVRRNVTVTREQLNVPMVSAAISTAFKDDCKICDIRGVPIPVDEWTNTAEYWLEGFRRGTRKYTAVGRVQSDKRIEAQRIEEEMAVKGQNVKKRPRWSDILLQEAEIKKQSEVADAAREVFKCAICLTCKISDPTVCRWCCVVVGCAACLHQAFDPEGTNETYETLLARCPLCQHLWVGENGEGGIELKGLSSLRRSLHHSEGPSTSSPNPLNETVSDEE